jgi:hypothetical protein
VEQLVLEVQVQQLLLMQVQQLRAGGGGGGRRKSRNYKWSRWNRMVVEVMEDTPNIKWNILILVEVVEALAISPGTGGAGGSGIVIIRYKFQ